jgi:hypothetical protein
LLRFLVSLVVLAVIAVVVVTVVVKATSSDSAKNDVSIRSCAATSGSQPKASGEILNHSSKTSNYVIRLKFTDTQGNTVSEGIAPIQSVDAHQTATWQITGDRDAKGSVRCELTGVSRTHVPGQ